jgi:RimJ/RimL family protein N-acetyltransferase
MASLLLDQSEAVGRFVAERSPLERVEWGPFVGIGIALDGKLAAGVVFSDWHPDSRRIELSGAVDDPRVLSPRILRALGAYAFGQLGVHRIWAKTSKDNRRALRWLEGIGFIREGTMAGFYGPERSAVILRVLEPEWRRKWGAIALKEAA